MRVHHLALRAGLALALAAAAMPGWSAGPAKSSQLQREYQQERARCLRGESGQERATCLKEAGAAYDEARRGRLANGPSADLAGNATQRCAAQPVADRDACVQRILGGNAQGSVPGGGLLRQTETPAK
jgi:type II secretory pathway pseudopilin PulG